jgi:hypothetical protein
MSRRALIGVLAAVTAVGVLGVMAAGVLLASRSGASAVGRWAPEECRQALASRQQPGQRQGPLGYYGVASSCELRRAEGHLIGAFKGSGYYVVTSDRGLFVSRVDYADPGVRFARGQTVEIAPDDVPAGILSISEMSRYQDDAARRGGVDTRPWRWGGYDG